MIFFLLLGVTVLISIDQITKYWAITQGIESYNMGISFGWNFFSPVMMVVLSTIVSAFFLYFAYKLLVQLQHSQDTPTLRLSKEKLELAGFALLAAGGFSNLIDRLIHGAVIDWLPFFTLKNFTIKNLEI